jgi:UDPglucose 6-dehydrogenase/GDP-mannose 6-dehydrogenase
MVSFGREHGQPMRLLEAVLAINADQPARMLSLLRRNTESLEGLKVTVLGLSFRPDTNDMRESPAIPIIGMLADAGCQITAYDPEAIEEARQVITTSGVSYADSLEKSVVNADAVLLVTRWDEFQRLSEVLRQHGRDPVVIDGRRSLDKSAFGRYDGIGL